jgi:molecular chaperone GrpE
MDDRYGIPGYTVRDRRWWAREEGEEDNREAGEAKPSYVATLEAELADRDRRLADALGRQERALEEQELARQRIEREAQREIARGKRDVIAALLPVLDDLDRAIAAAEEDRGALAFRRGIELVRSGFLDRLRALGVERDLPVPGQPFDPARHEAVSVVRGEIDGSVATTVSPGYLLDGELLRPARVVVTQSDRNGDTDYPAAR